GDGQLLAVSADVDAFAEDHGGQYPTDLNALPSTDDARSGVGISDVWGGVLRAPLSMAWPNLKQVRAGALLDPWGVPWLLRVDQQHQTFRLESYGADRKLGGSGDDADLVLTKREGNTALSFLDDEPLW
ncbi:MAG: type II secretion system protein GspG, partial [Planctomycetota bacterium]